MVVGVFENRVDGVRTERFSVSTKPERILVRNPLELQVAKTSQRPSINQTIGDGVGRSTWGAATRIHLTTSVYSQRHQRWVTKQGHRHNW